MCVCMFVLTVTYYSLSLTHSEKTREKGQWWNILTNLFIHTAAWFDLSYSQQHDLAFKNKSFKYNLEMTELLSSFLLFSSMVGRNCIVMAGWTTFIWLSSTRWAEQAWEKTNSLNQWQINGVSHSGPDNEIAIKSTVLNWSQNVYWGSCSKHTYLFLNLEDYFL